MSDTTLMPISISNKFSLSTITTALAAPTRNTAQSVAFQDVLTSNSGSTLEISSNFVFTMAPAHILSAPARNTAHIIAFQFILPKLDRELVRAWRYVGSWHFHPIAIGDDVKIFHYLGARFHPESDATSFDYEARVVHLHRSKDPEWVFFEIFPTGNRPPSLLFMPSSSANLGARGKTLYCGSIRHLSPKITLVQAFANLTHRDQSSSTKSQERLSPVYNAVQHVLSQITQKSSVLESTANHTQTITDTRTMDGHLAQSPPLNLHGPGLLPPVDVTPPFAIDFTDISHW
ncbi:hypothetical protein Hypma_001169 [Hypsizygus marmoreus]|uniref:Uncharacterized protein n=1 Tax=Hypsizygus marmoreus TaxID=39966 RepID=A0A369JAU2_HYPMA|nr:hypothetical protein Hypma_001169 [Hypsizygus marmoreus]